MCHRPRWRKAIKDSSVKANIQDTSSINLNHIIGIGDRVDFNSIVTIEIEKNKYVFSEFKIRKAKIETMFGNYYETCIIDSCKMNGEYINNRPFQIHLAYEILCEKYQLKNVKL